MHLLSLSAPNLCLETGLDTGDRSGGATSLTAQEVQSVRRLPLQLRVDRFTGSTSDVLQNVSSDHGLDLVRLELTLQDQSLFTIDGAGGTQFSEQELNQVLRISL